MQALYLKINLTFYYIYRNLECATLRPLVLLRFRVSKKEAVKGHFFCSYRKVVTEGFLWRMLLLLYICRMT